MSQGLYLGRQVDPLRAEVAQLAQQRPLTRVDPARLEAQEQVPAKTGVKLLRYDLLWIY